MSPDHRAVRWNPGAPAELEAPLLRSLDAASRDDGSEDISWVCPQCLQEQVSNVFRDEIWAGLDRASRSAELELRCDCGFTHENRPEGEVGCGYRTVVIAEEED